VLYSAYRFGEHSKDAALSLPQLPIAVFRLHYIMIFVEDLRGNFGNRSAYCRNKRVHKRPRIEIKKFNSDMKQWISFWSQFRKIHEDAELHDSDKFQYLVQSMVSGTRTRKSVTSYPQSTAYYLFVVKALKDRFGDRILLTEAYVKYLLKLVIRNTST
jgi:Protein of unknown function (DUF1759)